MNIRSVIGAAALFLAAALGVANARGQSADAVKVHKTLAKSAAGEEWTGLYRELCSAADRPAAAQRAASPAESAPSIPDRELWHHEPAKIFDNLYFVGMNDVGAWAVTTSQGIILIDALNDYAVEDEIVGGLRKLGLDPKQIKYVIVSHGHVTHFGGAKFLQDTYGARVGLSAADWTLIERTQGPEPKPRRDVIVTDGQKLTLGDTTITMYITPGHTAGTISMLIPVTDKGIRHVAVLSGISSASGADNLKTHIAAASRFTEIVWKARADVMISDEDHFSNYIKTIEAMAAGRVRSGAFVVGPSAVRRYMTVVKECSSAVLASL